MKRHWCSQWRLFVGGVACAAGLSFFALATTARTAEASPGSSVVVARLGDETFKLFRYRPRECSELSLLLVFHGHGRDASSYRDRSREIAEKACFVVYAPLFDQVRFPNWRYQRGGIVHRGEVLSENVWTVNLVSDLTRWIRREERRPDMPAVLFGHSAGAQFLSRVAAYAMPDNVVGIVLANASTYVFPLGQVEAPYGFGGLFEGDELTARLRSYLEAPITIFLGTEDTDEEDPLLVQSQEAMSQGSNRRQRGEHAFEAATLLSKDLGWKMNWKLVYAKGVGHDSVGMLDAPEALDVFGVEKSLPQPAGN